MATIHDVAQDAGVSPTTVSRYLNHRIELPPSTAARIDAAIRKLDYRPNLLAKRLSTGRTEAIGLVTPEIRQPFFAELASAVEDEADRHGYTIFISSTRSDRGREVAAVKRLHDRHVDGLILLTNTPDDGTLARLIGTRRAVVLVDEDIPGVNVPRIFVENEAGAHAATRHLLEAGHRSIAYLGGPAGLFSTIERQAGYLRALREAGVSVAPEMVRLGSFSSDFAYVAVRELMGSSRPPTAVFASSDYLLIGAIMGLRSLGLGLPAEVSLVGFDDVQPLTELMHPPLTAVRQPIDMLGRHGFLALHALLDGRPPPMLTRLPVELIRRASVTSPRRTKGLR
jgi:LacI family transcriptional regulator